MSQQLSGSSRNEKKRRYDTVDESSKTITPNDDAWPRFLVVEAVDFLPIKLNPFAISKAVSGICGEVKNVTRLRSGSLLVECARRQQSINLLSVKTFANIEVTVSAHRTLNSCQGVIRDRSRCLSDMSEEDIAAELVDQGVTGVKRFTVKKEGIIVKTNTYLLTFSRSSIPQSIKAGYLNIAEDVYVPSPLRCYKCQKFGHGSNSCRGSVICHRCSESHDNRDCDKELKCANCHGPHGASSKSCPVWQKENSIMRLKCEKNVSYLEAKKLFQTHTSSTLNVSYSAAVTRSVSTSSVACQTDLTWVKSGQPHVSVSVVKPSSPVVQTTSDSQTEKQPEAQSKTVTKQQASVNSSKTKGKKLNRKETPSVPLPSELPLENPFGPLDMEVTLSSQTEDKRRNSSSSHSRARSPIEPP
ncbi:uncharacterized protein [Haliotis asinina]|uniref:uncharacterized protein n=1 Tax=Haliotis asinina TaxID=109174 RepID=UPI003532061F